MVPIVNHKYKYILLYSAKAGCTSLRSLYLDVHRDELDESQLSALKKYHNVNEVQPYVVGDDYSDYFTYLITRNPYSRVVSAFLDQYVFLRNSGVERMLNEFAPGGSEREPQNFLEFLEYLKTIPDEKRDSHFQTQTFTEFADCIVTPASVRYRFAGLKHTHAFGIKYVGDISKFDKHTKKVFKRIFKRDKAKLEFSLSKLAKIQKRNSSFYGRENYDNAAMLSLDELDAMTFAPKPQDFYTDQRVVELVNEIYQDDFKWFNYAFGDIPTKSASKEIELIPDDFDWEMYIRLSPDLPTAEVRNERSTVRHYLEFGRFESIPRAYKIEAPDGFDWQNYLNLYADLPAAGIVSEEAAIEHYISYGIREGRVL